MLNNLLEMAKVEVSKEMDRAGFIDDSDNCDRFLDKLAKELAEKELLKSNDDIELYYEKEGDVEKLYEKLLEEIKSYLKNTYKEAGSCNDRGDYTGCYYENKKGLKNWNELSE